MLTESRVFRIAYLVQLAFEFGEACLGESDAKPDVLQDRCGAEVDPRKVSFPERARLRWHPHPWKFNKK
jgi:hypothetical protein